MSDLIHQFFGDAKKLRLSAAEKQAIWSTMPLTSLEKAEAFAKIARHMQRNPMPIDPTPTLSRFWHFHKLAASVMIAVLIITTGGGTAAYAAEGTVPGDTLYTVKVGVTEPLIDMALSFAPERRAEWERRRIKRRLKEAEHLSAREALTQEKREFIEQHVKERMEKLEEHLEEIPEELQSVIHERVDDVMKRHEEFLERIESGEIVRPEVKEFKKQMHDMRNRAHEKWGIQPPSLPPPPLLTEDQEEAVEHKEHDFLRPPRPRDGSVAPVRASSASVIQPPLSPQKPMHMLIEEENPTKNVRIHPPKELELPLEGWLSGRKRTTRNRVDPQGSRGFESPSLRHPAPSAKADYAEIGGSKPLFKR